MWTQQTLLLGYPNEEAAEVVLAALREWLEQHKDKVRPESGRQRGCRRGGRLVLSWCGGLVPALPRPTPQARLVCCERDGKECAA